MDSEILFNFYLEQKATHILYQSTPVVTKGPYCPRMKKMINDCKYMFRKHTII